MRQSRRGLRCSKTLRNSAVRRGTFGIDCTNAESRRTHGVFAAGTHGPRTHGNEEFLERNWSQRDQFHLIQQRDHSDGR